MSNTDHVTWLKEFMDVHKTIKEERNWSTGSDDSPLWTTLIKLDYGSKIFIGQGTSPTKKESRQIASEVIKTTIKNEFGRSSIWRK